MVVLSFYYDAGLHFREKSSLAPPFRDAHGRTDLQEHNASEQTS